jgi:hypothetical protein
MPTYNPQADVATADLWGASDHNILLHNIQAGVPDIFTAQGDLPYATGPDAAARLAIGTTNRHLAVFGGIPAWVDAYGLLEADLPFTTTTLTDATGLTFAIGASERWIARFYVLLTYANGTNGFKLTVAGPAGITAFNADAFLRPAGASGTMIPTTRINSQGSSIYANTSPAAANEVAGTIEVSVTNGATPGTISLQVAENVASGTINLKTGSKMEAIRKA